jgi:hypothetical protein
MEVLHLWVEFALFEISELALYTIEKELSVAHPYPLHLLGLLTPLIQG